MSTASSFASSLGNLKDPSVVAQTLDTLDVALATKLFREFVPQAWKIVEPARVFLPNWHMDAIAEHLQAVTDGQIRRLLITVPPGHAKSLLVSVLWPAWEWVNKPITRTIFTAYAESLAMRDSIRCRALIESDWYQAAFKPNWKLSSEQNTKSWFENTATGFRYSTGVGGGAPGRRGDHVVCDDPLSPKEQFSDAALEEVLFWWDQVMSSRLNDLSTGAFVIIMQRLSERDLAEHVIQQGTYEHLNLPTEFDPKRRAVTHLGWQDPRSDEGELLFPALFPPQVISDAKKALGSQGFAAQHQQTPSPEEGGILKRHWWKYWQNPGQNLPPVIVRVPDKGLVEIAPVDLPETFDVELQSWDMSFKDGANTDYVAGGVVGCKGANRYVLHTLRQRLDMPATVRAVKQLTLQFPHAITKLVEDKANGPAVIASLKNEVMGLIAVEPQGGKMSRAAAVSPEVEAGNWYVPHPQIASWTEGFINELATFPNGAHDDLVDMWSQAGIRLRRYRYGLTELLNSDPEAIYGKGNASESPRHVNGKTQEAEVLPKISHVDNLVKPVTGDKNGVSCPQCGSLAIGKVPGGKRCNACGTQFGNTQEAPPAQSRRDLLMEK